MLNFSKKLYGLAGAVTMFTGMAFGQVTCTTLAPSAVNFIRAEGQTELLPAITLGCNNATAATATLSVTLYLTPTIGITSPVVTSSTGATSAVATSSLPVVAPLVNTQPGIVNAGSSLVFSNISIPATAGAFTVTLSNVRVNATQIPTTAGAAPTAIAGQAFLSGVNVTPGNTGTASTVAFVTNGLTPSKFGAASGANDSKVQLSQTTTTTTSTSFGVCGSLNNSTSTTAAPTFFVSIGENFQTAFKTQVDENNGGADATSGTRIKLVFGNVPAGLNIYLPVTLTSGSVITATTSETGAFVAQTAVSTPAQFAGTLTAAATASGGVFQVPVSNGSAVAIYEVRTDSAGTLDTFNVPVYLQSGSNAVDSQSGSLTLQTSLAPVAAATTVPSFAALAGSSPSLNILSFSQCTTTLLFPFVTNVAGFETGIAIDNTTKDPFTTKAQSGTCTLSFYGTSSTSPTSGPAPNPNEGGTAPYLAGESYAFTLTSALQSASSTNPATFQGYMIANCNYQLAHGFAYITYGFPGTSSSTMGYLALVLNGRGSTSALGRRRRCAGCGYGGC